MGSEEASDGTPGKLHCPRTTPEDADPVQLEGPCRVDGTRGKRKPRGNPGSVGAATRGEVSLLFSAPTFRSAKWPT